MKIFTASIALYLLLGATSLGVRRSTRHQPASQLRSQVVAWWYIFPLVSIALALYPFGLFLLALLIGALAARELSGLTANPRSQFICQFACVGLTSALMTADAVPLEATIGMIGGALLLVLGIARRQARLVWLLLLLTASSISVVNAFVLLPLGENAKLSWLFYLFILTALNDIGQFVTGKLVGRTRIVPSLSPNKTWSGLFGGVAVSIMVSVCLGAWLDLSSTTRLVIYGVVLSLSGFLGDLLFSGVKRSLKIKDFSNLIPGHGGILDRVDSLVFTAPSLYLLLQCFE